MGKQTSDIPQIHIDASVANTPAWIRLQQQIAWYDKRSGQAQIKYKVLKTAQLLLAGSIPLTALYDSPVAKWAAAIAGALVAVMEGVQQLGQYSSLWLTYRATAEYLKHEKYLFLSTAGPYKSVSKEERLTLLAERVEERVSAEHANWINETRRTTKPSPSTGPSHP